MSMRTVIVLSPPSETTTPWRTRGRAGGALDGGWRLGLRLRPAPLARALAPLAPDLGLFLRGARPAPARARSAIALRPRLAAMFRARALAAAAWARAPPRRLGVGSRPGAAAGSSAGSSAGASSPRAPRRAASSAGGLLGARLPRQGLPRRASCGGPPRRGPPRSAAPPPRGPPRPPALLGARPRAVLRSFSSSIISRACRRSSTSTSIPRWRAIVSPRARSFLAALSRAVFSSWPVACWKRRLKSSSRERPTNSTSCGSSRLCTSTAFTAARPPRATRTWS